MTNLTKLFGSNSQKQNNRSKKKRSVERKFGNYIESLENRQLMAADLAVVEEAPASDQPAEVRTLAPNANVQDAASQSGSQSSGWTAAAENMHDRMQAMADETGRIALAEFDSLVALAGFTIEAPQFNEDGSISGTTQYGRESSPVLLQYVPAAEEWVLAIQTELDGLVPDEFASEAPIQLNSPIVVFSDAKMDIDSTELSDGSEAFYRELYQDDEFTVRLEKGINILTRGTVTEGSKVAQILDTLNLELPSVQLEGVVLGDYDRGSVDEFGESQKNKKFSEEFRERLQFRATLPEINVEGLPSNVAFGRGSLLWRSPATEKDYVAAELEFTIGGTQMTAALGFEDTAYGSELQVTASAANMRDAFGVTGLDLEEVELLIEVDAFRDASKKTDLNSNDPTANVPTLGIGLGAKMEIGGRYTALAGKVELNLVTGTPVRVALKGELESISSNELIDFANQLSGTEELSADSNLPDFELRNVLINIAPLGGDADLEIQDGIRLAGELYMNGELIAKVDGHIDQTDIVPKISLQAQTAEINLGELRVSEVEVDILMTQSVDDRYYVKGTVEVFGASHGVHIDINARQMHYEIRTEVEGLGLVHYKFQSTTLGIPEWTFEANVRNDLSTTLEEDVAGGLKEWSDQASKDFAKAQADLDKAQAEVDKLNQERAEAIAFAKKEFDAVKGDLAKAQRTVNSLSKRVRSLRGTEARYRSDWLRSMNSRKKAKWYNYASRRATEIRNYSRFRGIQAARISAQSALSGASSVLGEVRKGAGWALKAAGPEAHPRVIAINAELAVKTAALDTAKAAVKVAEVASTGSADVLAFVAESHDDLFMIDEIRFSGTLSAAILNSSFDLEIEYRFLNEADTFKLATPEFDIEKLAEQLKAELITAV